MAAVALSWAFIMGIYGTMLVFPTCTRQYVKFVRTGDIKDISPECQSDYNKNRHCFETNSVQFYGPGLENVDCVQVWQAVADRHEYNLANGGYFMPDDP